MIPLYVYTSSLSERGPRELDGLAQLRTLQVDCDFSPDPVGHPFRAALPNLQLLTLSMCVSGCAALLQHLDMPAQAYAVASSLEFPDNMDVMFSQAWKYVLTETLARAAHASKRRKLLSVSGPILSVCFSVCVWSYGDSEQPTDLMDALLNHIIYATILPTSEHLDCTLSEGLLQSVTALRLVGL